MPDPLDSRFAAASIRLGQSALGSTFPNPSVGVVVVKDGLVVGRGHTGPGGRPHGETRALDMAGEAARGATLYVSLEPCAHHGKTPPCTGAIVAAGIARVVAPRQDPDPRVAGKGFQRLRDGGVEVEAGLLSREAGDAQAGHICRVEKGRPYVLLKLAVAADDAIGRHGESQVAVTGERARRHVQALRARFDAILVGSGTIEADDPELTCRLPGLEARSPIRVVLDTGGRLGARHRVFSGAAPTWVLGGFPVDTEAGNVRRRRVPFAAGKVDLHAALAHLAELGITRVLLEGGARLARSFLEADLIDEVMLFRSSQPLGGDIVRALAGLPMSVIEASERFRHIERRSFGPDRMTRYTRMT